jgi:hypothetical protein
MYFSLISGQSPVEIGDKPMLASEPVTTLVVGDAVPIFPQATIK